MGTIAVIGTLNNYGEEIRLLKESIEERGHKTLLIDISMGGEPSFAGDITCAQIAASGGVDIEEIRASTDRRKISEIMTNGLIKKTADLYSQGRFDGIIVCGGATTSMIGCKALQALPFGVPKLVVSSSGAFEGLAHRLLGNKDMMLMHTYVDPVGVNYFAKSVLERAAGAISGMTDVFLKKNLGLDFADTARHYVPITTFAFCDTCANRVKQQLEEAGFQTVIFHSQGLGDRALDELIDQNTRFRAIVELAPAGVSEQIFGGHRAAGTRRLEAASERGIPQVCAPTGLNWVGGGSFPSMKRKYRRRIFKIIDEPRTEVKLTPQEIKKVARVVAQKLSKGNGAVKFLFALKGWSSLEREGDPFYQPEIDRLFVDEFKKLTAGSPKIEIKEIDAHINDEAFAKEVFKAVMEMI
jgi:uncharacterized protein (UPF0261 family)